MTSCGRYGGRKLYFLRQVDIEYTKIASPDVYTPKKTVRFGNKELEWQYCSISSSRSSGKNSSAAPNDSNIAGNSSIMRSYAMVNPESLFQRMRDKEDEEANFGKNVLRTIAISKIEEFARSLDDSVDIDCKDDRLPVQFFCSQDKYPR